MSRLNQYNIYTNIKSILKVLNSIMFSADTNELATQKILNFLKTPTPFNQCKKVPLSYKKLFFEKSGHGNIAPTGGTPTGFLLFCFVTV